MNLTDINAKASELGLILRGIDPDRIDAAPAFRQYFASYRNDLEYVLPRYARILHLACGPRDLEATAFLDFGGGTGVLALLAKLCGMRQVVYMDISEDMRRGALELARLCSIDIQAFLSGSYEDLDRVCPYRFDVIANYDVLEHLYRPSEAFGQLKSILNESGVILMASGANTYNPVTNLLFRSFHRRCELKGEGQGALINIRRELIQEAFPDLSAGEADRLAAATRGQRKDDILRAVAAYRESGLLPRPADKTNTCDPLTGSGAENLLNIFGLRQELESEFSFVEVGAGLYPRTKISFQKASGGGNIVNRVYPYLNLIAKIAAPLLNFMIARLPLRYRLILAPHYYIRAQK